MIGAGSGRCCGDEDGRAHKDRATCGKAPYAAQLLDMKCDMRGIHVGDPLECELRDQCALILLLSSGCEVLGGGLQDGGEFDGVLDFETGL